MMKPAIPIAAIKIMNMFNPAKNENAGSTELLAIRVAEEANVAIIIATTLIMATMGIMTLIRLE